VAADDVSVTTVRDSIPATSGVAPMQIVFATTAGTFAQTGASAATIATDGTGVATAQLRAPRASGIAQVSAAADTTVQYEALTFVPAEPDDLQVEPSSFGVTQTDTAAVTIRVLLLRRIGLVSPGVRVTFADTSNGRRIGMFGIAPPSDDSGLVRVRYAPRTGVDTVADTVHVAIADTIYAVVISNGTIVAHGSTVITVRP
jgi:hypothetical protein